MMENQPQNLEFRNNPENFHSCSLAQGICCNSNTKGLTLSLGCLLITFANNLDPDQAWQSGSKLVTD